MKVSLSKLLKSYCGSGKLVRSKSTRENTRTSATDSRVMGKCSHNIYPVTPTYPSTHPILTCSKYGRSWGSLDQLMSRICGCYTQPPTLPHTHPPTVTSSHLLEGRSLLGLVRPADVQDLWVLHPTTHPPTHPPSHPPTVTSSHLLEGRSLLGLVRPADVQDLWVLHPTTHPPTVTSSHLLEGRLLLGLVRPADVQDLWVLYPTTHPPTHPPSHPPTVTSSHLLEGRSLLGLVRPADVQDLPDSLRGVAVELRPETHRLDRRQNL